MTETTTLICPKCQGAMRTYERSGIVIDQCTECRGIFLDRGELERLMDAEMVSSPVAPRGDIDDGHSGRERDHDDDHDPYALRGRERDDDHREDEWRRRDPRGGRPGAERRREGRFGGLFDLFGD